MNRTIEESRVYAMCIVPVNVNSKASIREKARLNISIAKDLADNFGGSKTDYLARLNQRLRKQIATNSPSYP